jgi:predicted GTPase
MKADASYEQRFIAEVDAFEFIAHDVGENVRAMENWLAHFGIDLQEKRLIPAGFRAHSALVTQANAINEVVQRRMRAWADQWKRLEPAHALADSFDQQILLLVFGKFNAGKSSFCNLLAERFASHGKSMTYFYLDAGRIIESAERLAEGVTETTARLQGVRLAETLVLVDTPGLHSITPENAALTQRFTDSADAVLWLTSSTSPGQVQELDELARELHRNKPLLPVVTRSDVYEEDEIDGEIRKVLRGKTAENRAEQEGDVHARAQQKLVQMGVDRALLQAPVSVSSHLAREQNQTRTAMIDAGFERLYSALLAITEPALEYKRRKQAEVFLHHLEENVLGALSEEVNVLLARLHAASDHAFETLDAAQQQLANAVWRAVVPQLPPLLDDTSAIKQVIRNAHAHELQTQLGEYDVAAQEITLELNDVDYEAVKQAVADCIRHLSQAATDQCRASIESLRNDARALIDTLESHEADLQALKRALRPHS